VSAQTRSVMAVAIGAGAIFALALGIRQAQPLFISAINSNTGIGYATISLAFGIAQLMWGLAQPLAGAVADRWGARPGMVSRAIGVPAAAGAGALGPSLLLSAANRWIPEAKRSVASGIVNAGGSFGQFTLIPFAQLLIGLAGWQPALLAPGATGLRALP